MILFFVRHGEPDYGTDSLTPLGRRQADALARRFGRYGLDRIYSSPAGRVLATARPTCDILKMEPIVLDWLAESHSWREMSVEGPDGSRRLCSDDPTLARTLLGGEVAALGARWHEHPAFAGLRFGEGVARMRREADAFLASLGYVHDAECRCFRVEKPPFGRIAFFGHEVSGMLFVSTILDIPFPVMAAHFQFGHTGITAIEFRDLGGWSVPKVLQLSNDGHIYGEGIPPSYCGREPF